MPRTRAYRRHKRAVKLARRWRILDAYEMNTWRDEHQRKDARDMNAHLRCGCFGKAAERRRERKRERREWLRNELELA